MTVEDWCALCLRMRNRRRHYTGHRWFLLWRWWRLGFCYTWEIFHSRSESVSF